MKSVAAAGCVIVAALLVPRPASATDTLGLKVEAGLGGVGKAGRWCPVRVSVENTGQDLTGDLVVGWGDSTVHRRVVIPAPSRRQFDVYLRTSDVRAAVRVELRADGADLRVVDAPMRALPPDSEATLCVTSAGDDVAGSVDCAASVTATDLPRSMRGYDAVDRIAWRAGPEALLSPAQRDALQGWRAYRHLDEAGAIARAPRPAATNAAAPSPASTTLLAVGTLVYGTTLIVIVAIGAKSPRRPWLVHVALPAMAALGSSAALAAGHAGPASAVVVRYASTLQQLPGSDALISMRGHVEYPTADAFQIRAGLTDAELQPAVRPAGDVWFDEEGYPIIAGTAGLGTAREFALEGVARLAPLAIERRADLVRVRNATDTDLRACAFPEGFSVQQVGTLRPGQTVEARALTAGETDYFSCTLVSPPVDFTDAHYPVHVDSASIVIAYLPSASPTIASAR